MQVEHIKVTTRKHEYGYENGILRRHDEDSNQHIQKHIGVTEVSIRKNVSCESLAEKCTTLMNERSAVQLFIFSHSEVIFLFSFHSERTPHIKKKSSISRT